MKKSLSCTKIDDEYVLSSFESDVSIGCPHKTHILGFRFWLLDFNFLGYNPKIWIYVVVSTQTLFGLLFGFCLQGVCYYPEG